MAMIKIIQIDFIFYQVKLHELFSYFSSMKNLEDGTPEEEETETNEDEVNQANIIHVQGDFKKWFGVLEASR